MPLVADVLKNDAWRNLSAKTNKELDNAAEEARRLGRILDATGYLDDKVLRPENALVIDVRLKSDLKAVQDQIEHMFETNEAPNRGFVYIAWCAKPEDYWYVGKAKNDERLNLASNGKLARATADATQLSLLFPSQSKPDILAGVEAAMIAVIESRTGGLPKLNAKRERVVENRGTEELRSLSGFLWSISDDLHRERLKSAA
jgi:hypothetical protein